jgi:hypothetical protein
VRQPARQGREDQPIVIAARELPESHAFGPEAYLDRLAFERRELTAGLDADAVEESGEARVGLEDCDRKRA